MKRRKGRASEGLTVVLTLSFLYLEAFVLNCKSLQWTMLLWSTPLQSGCETYKCYVAYGWINTAFIPINIIFSRCRIVQRHLNRWAPGASWPQPERKSMFLMGDIWQRNIHLSAITFLHQHSGPGSVRLQWLCRGRSNSGTYFILCLWANKHYSLSDWPQGGRRGSPKTSAEGRV